MGTRGSIVVFTTQGEDKVYLYTQYDAYDLATTLKNALTRSQHRSQHRSQSRWDDMPYLARIIFCEMVKDDMLGTGTFGISSTPQDGGELYVDVDAQKIYSKKYPSEAVSFTDFVETVGIENTDTFTRL